MSEVVREIRNQIREGKWKGNTYGQAIGYVQSGLAILPKSLAFEFLLFCQRNPAPCPILDVTDTGDFEAKNIAPESDITRDLPKYRIHKKGELVEEVHDISSYWRNDLVGFMVGCSFTFETLLLQKGIPIRHIEENKRLPIYISNIECKPAGPFRGQMAVSMRPIPANLVSQTVQITSRIPLSHGAPIHIGSPGMLGINNIDRPDFGDPVTIKEGEIPVFWPCGVTVQVINRIAKPEILITESPGHMFITDIKCEDLIRF